MPSIFKVVQLLCIQLTLTATAWASTGTKCHFSQGPVGLGYRAACDGMKTNWYPRFEDALVDIYATERHGLMSFDWDQIHAECRLLNQRADFCEKL